jgi:hypothetical protein
VVSAPIVVPAALVAIALVDAALAGYRAATGRNGRIGKRRYYLVALRRGLAAGVALLVGLAVVLAAALGIAAHPAERYADLTHAGTVMLWIIGPYAIVVLLSIGGYALLPRAPATFLILLGLGPFTLVRPWLTIAAGVAAAWTASDPVTRACALLAAAGVLAVEPWLSRRWYAEPQ